MSLASQAPPGRSAVPPRHDGSGVRVRFQLQNHKSTDTDGGRPVHRSTGERPRP